MTAAVEAPQGARAEQVERMGRVGFALGVALIVAGGLVAAITSPLELPKGSWLAAYLVLVCGVAQCVLVRRGGPSATAGATAGGLRLSLIGWNAGNALVIVGVFTAMPVVVDLGGILLLAVLVASLVATRQHAASAPLMLYRIALVLLIVSIPVGLVLAHVRAAA